jgi:hypothetical protein
VASFDEVVPPGQAGKIRASIHTQNYRGNVSKSITVEHNDASQPAIMLAVNLNIVGSVNVLPYPALALAPRMQGFHSPALLIVRRDDSETGTLELTDVAASVPWLKIGVRKVAAPEPAAAGLPEAKPGDFVVSVQVEGAPPMGIHAETLTFKTGLAREPVVSIPVHVTLRAPVFLQPAELILNPNPDDPNRASGQASVAVREDLDPKTLTVASADPAFILRIDDPGARTFHITVDWAAKGKKTPTESELRFSVSGESLSLPVRVNQGLRESMQKPGPAKP